MEVRNNVKLDVLNEKKKMLRVKTRKVRKQKREHCGDVHHHKKIYLYGDG